MELTGSLFLIALPIACSAFFSVAEISMAASTCCAPLGI
jgi:CBS domain containing-hemolysin-like protein